MSNIRKVIERRHGEDPGMANGFARCYAGICESRKGIKRAQSLVKENHGAREIAHVRDKIDEAELWLARAVHAVKSEPYPPRNDDDGYGTDPENGREVSL